jgi:SAM-dependent methyltransferase
VTHGGTWDPAAYDDVQSFVADYGTDLLALLDPSAGERVLDLGCGTGTLAARLVDAGARPVGADRSAPMLARARREHRGIDLVRADARALPFAGAFDAVLSNAVLHWVPERDQDAALAAVRTSLVPGGRFVAELGGRGNVAAIVEAVVEELRDRGYDPDDPWHFPRLGAYADRLERVGFEVRHARLFDRPTDLEGDEGLRRWLEQFGDALLAPAGEEREAVVAAVEDRLRGELYDPDRGEAGAWVADYRRLRFAAVRT